MAQIFTEDTAGGAALEGLQGAVEEFCRLFPNGLPHEATIVIVARGGPARRTLEIAFHGRKSEDLLLDVVEKLDAVIMEHAIEEDDDDEDEPSFPKKAMQ